MNKSKKFSPEARERAVRLVQEHRGEYPSLWAAVESIASKIGCVPQGLLTWVKGQEVDSGVRNGVTTTEAKGVKEPERENQGTAPSQLDLEAGECFFRPDGTRPPTQVLREFIDAQRDTFGVEPICKVLQIAPSGYRRHAACQRNPTLRCFRAHRDDALVPEIRRVWHTNFQAYGTDKV